MLQNVKSDFDVAVIGGGPAGFSAAILLGRARRSVVVIDAGQPRNAPAGGVHNFLSRDAITPADLVAAGRAEVQRYGGVLIDGEATGAGRGSRGFKVTMHDGRQVSAKRLLVTTGLIDELPEIPGVRERWGRDVVHCPFCHGWEIRDQPIGVLGSGPMAFHQAMMFRQLTADLVLFTNSAPPLTADELETLAARGIVVVDGAVDSLVVTDDQLTGVRLRDGRVVPRAAVTVTPRFVARSQLLTELGLSAVAHPMGVGDHIVADPAGRTEVPGVWVAGNVTDLMAQVVSAAAQGAMTGAQIHAELMAEDIQRAVADHRAADLLRVGSSG